ncbi:MAG: metalloregulator ArsR/SmtB family transcription factor [Bacteroidota bacterium]
MDISKSIEIMKSLADTSRLRIINSIIDKPQYVEELAHRLNLASSTVSFHLRKLESAGLITQEKEQYYVIYKINEEIFRSTLKELTDFDDIEKFAYEERINNYKAKVLKAFINKGKLIKLPVQRKKRLIVLSEFVKKFKAGKKYAEENVNEIITQSCDDYCTIRRLLVEEGFMHREKQIYWLTKEINEGKTK